MKSTLNPKSSEGNVLLMHADVITILSLGFFLGLKHALDADHLVAISTIVSEERTVFRSSYVGALWGVGHTAALLVVGSIVIALNLRIEEHVAMMLELGVAAMLVFLGMQVLWKVFRGHTLHVHVHKHHGRTHIHPHMHPHNAAHSHAEEEAPAAQAHHESWLQRLLKRLLRDASDLRRSIIIGMIHGIAGSAALMLVVLATITDRTLAVLYIAIFGAGSIGGMMVMSTVIGFPVALAASRSLRLNRVIRGVAGLASIGFGLFLAWEIAG